MQMTLKKMGIETKSPMTMPLASAIFKRIILIFVTDLKLPDGTGLDIVKFINKNLPKTPWQWLPLTVVWIWRLKR